MTPEQKKWIDDSSYETLLRKWRFAPSGDPLLQEEVGEYYAGVMFKKKAAIGDSGAVAASKAVGWE